MDDRIQKPSLAGLKWVHIYHGILISIGFYFITTYTLLLRTYDEPVFIVYILAIAAAVLALCAATIGIVWRRSGAFLLAMICHGLLAVVGALAFIAFVIVGLISSAGGGEAAKWSSLFFVFAFMWLPLVVISRAAFIYLHRLHEWFRSQITTTE